MAKGDSLKQPKASSFLIYPRCEKQYPKTKLQVQLWIGEKELEDRILKSTIAETVVFAAKWCSFCLSFIRLLEQEKSESSFPVYVIDTDSGDLWEKFRVRIVPTIVLFMEGKEIFRIDGKPMRGLSEKDLASALSKRKEMFQSN